MADEQTINIPQLLLVLILGGVAVKYFFFSSAPGGARHRAPTVRAREADVEQIQQMFPQVDRRGIMWDLQRNGGSIAATTERILSGRGLEIPPPTFQPSPPPQPVGASATRPASGSSASKKPAEPDLITRYNLHSKINAPTTDGEPLPSGKQAWSQNKNERQSLMQRRREEMILKARRDMEAKIAAEKESVECSA